MIPATVNVNRLATHMPNLKSSSVYSLTVFDVTRCNQNYRLSDSALLIRFSDSNSFNEVKPAVLIPLEFFWLRHNHSDMICLSNTNTQFLDLIGEITVVMSTVTDPSQDKNRVMATIKMDNDMYVTMSLFDSQAVKIHNQQETMRGNPRVVVATSVNPKMVGGRLFLNATSGTHIYFDKETTAGESFFYMLVAQDTGLTPASPLLRWNP
ncbi:PREDICTED: uncharacterized protein LOC106345115 [Brassica oleracea var. oleracea]|uniref:DUF223 domain-containing protein n=1 Tax=Brassica oleracea var. oleracea TaxID=109376 RepID=A0A0D3AD21_BRAOL|nr:PREDICTED: uncharacterized protein LOC106345115 [Brassica oleracea var. oleracea]